MRLLLFCISLIFSAIFYSFHLLSQGKNIYFERVFPEKAFQSLSSGLWIEASIFLTIAVIFVVYFSPITQKTVKKSVRDDIFFFYISFYGIFFLLIFSPFFKRDFFILSVIAFFLFSEICFNYISRIELFRKQKISIKYFGLIMNYISTFLSIYYIFFNGFSFFLFLILIFNTVFNFYLHKHYTNYISFVISGIIGFFLLYFILFEIYLFLLHIF